MRDGNGPDPENSLAFSEWFDYDAIDGPAPERPGIEAIEFLKRVISFVRRHPRKVVTLDCIFLATGDAEMDGVSFTKVAERHGMTKAAISVRVKEVQAKLGLGPCRAQKSKAASKSYANSNWRPNTAPDSA